MLIIRKKQMDVLTEYMHGRFENFMVPYLRDLFPKDCQILDDHRLRRLIRKGIKDAKTYGIEMYSEIAKYISLYFFLSFDFDKDDRYPWAKQQLMRKNISETEKMRHLMQKTREAIKHNTQETRDG